jgi:hypothetical protein
MRQLEAALRQLAERAEPLPTEVVIARIETELGWTGTPWAVAEREEPIMVTHQQPNVETRTPPPPPPQRSRRGPLLAAAVAAVVILAGVGIAYASGVFDSDADVAAGRLAVATELADTWNQGWEDYDPEMVASVFTDDGVYIEADGTTWTAKNVKYFVLGNVFLSNVIRVGELTPSGDNTYTWVGEFDVDSTGDRYRANWEIELDGDLAARIQLVDDLVEIEPASDS